VAQGESFIGTASNVRQINEFLGWANVDDTRKDEVFKEIFRYKWAAAILLKNCITAYKDMHPLKIVKLIKDEKQRGPMSDAQLVQDEIDLIVGTEGTGVQKNTLQDLTFGAYTDEKREIINLITVNFEMQNEFKKGKPNTISRAVYYAASKLQATVSAGDKNYANLHKIYTIWLCADDVVLGEPPSIKDICKASKIEYLYKSRFNMMLHYDEIPDKTYGMYKEADLMEVVMVDLCVLQEKVSNGVASADETVMYKSLYNLPSAIPLMENVYSVELSNFEGGVINKMSLLERLEEKDKQLEEQAVGYKKQLEEQAVGYKKQLEEQAVGYKKQLEEQEKQLEEQEKQIEEFKRQLAELQLS